MEGMAPRWRAGAVAVAMVAALCLTSVTASVGLSFSHLSSPFSPHLSALAGNETDIPSWSIGDTWTYTADIYYDGSNGSFDGTITDLSISVSNITTVMQNGQTWDAYALNMTGNITGSISYEGISGPLDGNVTGDLFMRRADLSLISYNVTSTGVIHQIIDLDYEAHINGSQHPPAEEYDFPIQVNDVWNITSTSNTSGSIWVQGLVDETFSGEQQATTIQACSRTENITVPAGTFSTFYVHETENNTTQSWYAPAAENTVRYIVNRTTDNTTTHIYANLTGYNFVSQSVTVTQHIIPPTAQAGETVTVRGSVFNTTTGIPVSNASITVAIPLADVMWTTTTNATGNYTVACGVPAVADHTPTGDDIASVGVIVSADAGHPVFTVRTLTITGIHHTYSLSSGWNLITVPVAHAYNASSLGQAIPNCTIVASWNASTSTFASFVVGTSPPSMAFPIQEGVGYFVYVAAPTTFSVTGAPLSTVAVALYPGWNTIGWFDAAATTASSLAGAVPHCTIVAYWNASTSTFASFVVGSSPPPGFSITRGRGLFVYVTAGGVWNGQG